MNIFAHILLRCVQQDINITVIESIAHKVMVSVVLYICPDEVVISDELLEKNNSRGILGVYITITPNVDDWFGESLHQLIQAVPQVRQVRDKLTVFAMSRHVERDVDTCDQARHPEDDREEGCRIY